MTEAHQLINQPLIETHREQLVAHGLPAANEETQPHKTPLGQGWELRTAIAATGTETEIVVYPREGRVPMERAHELDAIRRTQAGSIGICARSTESSASGLA